ncbi:MAG: beta-lactamase domain protein [Solirubrobacterales bacterium]|jgi:glyoxylase-like metal-dependent hydrolase (beta-lactamase superfamily II)/ketosteroid isomerase-like protein|nr:beta-lactamase domain protein [Solirubrobacterales bacterium]
MPEEDGASEASTKVQEAAASVQQVARKRKRISGSKAESVARRYFEAIDARDLETALSLWADGAHEFVRGQVDTVAPEGVRAFMGGLIDAVPDLHMEVVSTTTEGERCGVQWRLTGTFAGPGDFAGVEPTGRPIELEGFDLITVRDGLIHGNDAFTDSMTFARQIGMMPPQGSTAEQRMTSAFNAKTRLSGRVGAAEAQLVAEGVWLVQGQPGRCNVFLIEDDGGATMFDAGARTMTRAVASAGARRGGIRRVVLGHAHTDHRGTAPGLGAPVLCHPDEVQDAEGSGGFRYWPQGLQGLPFGMRQLHRLMHRYAWDGGPVEISGTLVEGDEVAGFRVIELPGHAPGQIGLWRERDRLALSSDCFYTLDMWGRDSAPHIPERLYNYDTDQARASIRKLAALEPAAAWPGHANAITGDVRSQLERAADAG